MKNLVFLIFLSACSLFKLGVEDRISEVELPNWIFSPYELCQENLEFCATGEGKNFNDSDLSAKSNLASIFEVQVTSEFSSVTTSDQRYPWHASVSMEVQKSVSESINQVLEAVQIKKRFKKDGLSYSLASLDRTAAGRLVSARLDKIDQELEVLWKRKQRTSLRKITSLSLEREKLNERYSLIAGVPRPAPVTYKQILVWRDSRTVSEPVFIKSGQVPDWIMDKIRELLTEAGFRVVSTQSEKVLEVNISSIKEYLNVEGFEKYTFTLGVSCIVDGVKGKEIFSSETVMARNQTDALLKVKSFFNNYLEQHLSDLNLD